ncbi:MAG: LytTR family DNA-binding domain-containing protein [Cytophagales bacterium]|nr:LytTR family DNA-binding domain-containing protein [Cytophagales bacterium]
MRVLIIEDEKHTALRLIQLLNNYDPKIEIIRVLSSVKEAVGFFRKNSSPDLVFQDIELSDGKCFEIYQQVQVEAPTIFTTAYSEYALKSFEVNSIDYLVKPYDAGDIKRVMDKFRSFSDLFQLPQKDLLKDLVISKSVTAKKRILVRIGDTYSVIAIKDISYFSSEAGRNYAHLYDGSKKSIDQTLNELVMQLDPSDFFRINRNFVLNINCISKISTWFNSRLKLEIDPKPIDDVIVSRERVKEFKMWLDR